MTYKYSFSDDYSEGAHPQILAALTRTNLPQEPGYGKDSFCQEAVRLLREKVGNPDADIHFVVTGTQANLIACAAMLRPYESVIAPVSGHIATHEAGAVEATGHKITVIPTAQGRLSCPDIEQVVQEHTDEHMVKPRAVFIAHATEVSTMYTKAELHALSQLCRAQQLYLYMDGARLGAALTAAEADLTLADVSTVVDIFSIGGTKNGALLGEAIVINHPTLKEHFRSYLKQRGALLAKGRVLGVQFVELFKGDLYFDLAKHANAVAGKLSEGLNNQGYPCWIASTTNQIFPIFPHAVIGQLQVQYGFHVWANVDAAHSAVRLVTSWATPEAAVEEFLADLRQL